MKKLILITALPLALAACGDGPEEAESGETVDMTVAEDGEVALGGETARNLNASYSGTSWQWVANDGNEMTTTFTEDGAYQVTGDGMVADQGSWSYRDGRICLDTDMEDREDQCWTAPRTAISQGDTIVASTDDGENVELTRIAYTPARVEAPQ